MKPENTFRTWFIEKTKGYVNQHYPRLPLRFQKHADYVTSGVPDMDVSMAGLTIWLEVKCLPTCTKARTLHVTALQRAHLDSLAEVGVGRGLLVGLALGPRKGYDVAFYHETLPTVAHRNDFRPWTVVVDEMVSVAQGRAAFAHALLHSLHCGGRGLVGHLPLLAPRVESELGIDDAHEDGG